MARERDDRGGRVSAVSSPRGEAKSQQDRTRIAQATARLIAEHGIKDWSAAKRKAAREVGLHGSAALPATEDIERALIEYHALFDADSHAGTLRAQRTEALRWMRRLARFTPRLVGGVAAGWATEHSDIRLELLCDDPKAVEMALAGEGLHYTALAGRGEDNGGSSPAQLLIDTPQASVRLSIVSPVQRRSRPRRDDEPRLDAVEVAALLEAN